MRSAPPGWPVTSAGAHPIYRSASPGGPSHPSLYFAIGISGAVHHVAGCANSRVIVAINSDADAPIFALSRFGIVGDCHDLMPALIAEAEASKT